MEVSDTMLRRLRRERAWSIRELAQRAGVSMETIYSLEHGRREWAWPRTVNYIHTTLHKALKDAVSDALIPRNAASVRAPRPEKPEIHPLAPEGARKLIATARETEDRFEALYVLALHCGLREGELLGLKWEDIDLS